MTAKPQRMFDSQMSSGPVDYSAITLLADIVDDLEATRKANENRLRTLISDGKHGKAVDASEADILSELVARLKSDEDFAIKHLVKAVKRSPLGPYVKATPGLGEKTVGRLLGLISDPAWNYKEDRPRKIRELYAYCGLHVISPPTTHVSHAIHGKTGGGGGKNPRSNTQRPLGSQPLYGVAPRRIKGQQVNWSTEAKTRLHIMVEPMVKNRQSAYRGLYDDAKAKYALSTHTVDCKGCRNNKNGDTDGTVGSLLAPGHIESRAYRIVSKAILHDLWVAAQFCPNPPPSVSPPARVAVVGVGAEDFPHPPPESKTKASYCLVGVGV